MGTETYGDTASSERRTCNHRGAASTQVGPVRLLHRNVHQFKSSTAGENSFSQSVKHASTKKPKLMIKSRWLTGTWSPVTPYNSSARKSLRNAKHTTKTATRPPEAKARPCKVNRCWKGSPLFHLRFSKDSWELRVGVLCEKIINLFLRKNQAHHVLLLPGRSFESRLNLESEIVVHGDGAVIVQVNVEHKFR